MENIYYVYEWIRLDTNEPFYIGKGKDNRCYKLTRGNNHHFNNIVKSIPCAVNILHDGLEEQMAYNLECWYIWQYRDIIGYDLCNMNDGGEGQSLCGEANGMFGKESPFKNKHHTDEAKEKNRQSHLGKQTGKNNPMYGKSAYEGKTEEEMKEIGKKISKALKGRQFSDESKKKISEALKGKNVGRNSGKATGVICLTTKRIFFTVKEASEYYDCSYTRICDCCKGFRMYKGKKQDVNFAGKLSNGVKLKWKRVNWKHNKKFRIKRGGFDE